MSYSSYASSITDNNNAIKETKTNILKIDLSSIWEGNAQKKQTSNLSELTSNLDTQNKQLETLAEVLTSIDKYDKLAKEIQELVNELNSLDDKDKNYATRYHELNEQIRAKTTEKNNLKASIESSINSISTNYTNKLTKIPATEVEKTLDAFAEAEAIGLKLGDAFKILATKNNADITSSKHNAGTITLDKQGTVYDKEPTPGKSAQKLHVYHEGTRLYDDACITVKKGDTIRLVVNLSDNAGEVKQLTRTTADGQPEWRNYMSAVSEPFVNRYDKSTFLETDNFEWVIKADKTTNGYVTLSQTTFHSTDKGSEFKSMYRIKIKVVD